MAGDYNYQKLPAFTGDELSLKTWNEERRKEILELFRSEVYGRIFYSTADNDIAGESSVSVSHRVAETRPGFMEGRAVRKIIEITVKRKGLEFTFPLYLFIPEKACSQRAGNKKVPLILTLNNRALSDTDPSRRSLSPFWPAELMISRGYGAGALITHEIAPDYEEGFTTRLHRLFPEYAENRPPDAWGSITAWAWGMSRAIDYLETDPAINGREIIIAGHSRGGKTSLWCGAQDPRAAMVISNCSGCSGAAITRGKTGEHIKDITGRFPFWFCENYKKYAHNEEDMPFDQHLLLGLIAPRPLYISDKTLDDWCDPRAEYESVKQASKIYELYGKADPLGDTMPGPDEQILSGNLAYHIHSGEHDMDLGDWERYINFCDIHFNPLRE